MPRFALMALGLLLAVCAGCGGPTFAHSLADPGQPDAVDERLLGKWYLVPDAGERATEEHRMPVMVAADPGGGLSVAYTDSTEEFKASLHACTLGKGLFLSGKIKDFDPPKKRPIRPKARTESKPDLPYFVVACRIEKDGMALHSFDQEVFRASIAAGRLAGEEETRGNRKVLVTATTADVRAFLGKLSDEELQKLIDPKPFWRFSREEPPKAK